MIIIPISFTLGNTAFTCVLGVRRVSGTLSYPFDPSTSTWSTGSQISRSPCFCPFLKSLLVPPPSTLSFLCCTVTTWRAKSWPQQDKTCSHWCILFPLTHQCADPHTCTPSTLSMILPFSCVGEGSCSAICSTGSVRSLSPNTSLKIRAIWRCCSKGQCSSMDKINGNLRDGHQNNNGWLWDDNARDRF